MCSLFQNSACFQTASLPWAKTLVKADFAGEGTSTPRTGWGLITHGAEGSFMQLQDE